MANIPRPPTLADLVRIDWLILENKRLTDTIRDLIEGSRETGQESLKEQSRYAQLVKRKGILTAERDAIRGHFTRRK